MRRPTFAMAMVLRVLADADEWVTIHAMTRRAGIAPSRAMYNAVNQFIRQHPAWFVAEKLAEPRRGQWRAWRVTPEGRSCIIQMLAPLQLRCLDYQDLAA